MNNVLPGFESNFNMKKFTENMSEKTKIIIYITNYLHGFMNLHSNILIPAGYKHYIDWLIR